MGDAHFLIGHCSLLVVLVISLLLFSCARSEVYKVGDEEGWNSEINFNSWSRKHIFNLGDVLVFKYGKTEHNVYEVTEATYRSCDASSGVLAKYDSGNDRIELSEARKYWFICNVAGHCLGGMRLIVDVKEAANATSSTNSTTNVVDSTTSPDNSCIRHGFGSWIMWIYLLPFGILFRYS